MSWSIYEFALELALQKAKYYNLPRDVVDKAIKNDLTIEVRRFERSFLWMIWTGGVAI